MAKDKMINLLPAESVLEEVHGSIGDTIFLTNMRLVHRSSGISKTHSWQKSFFLENLDSLERTTTAGPGFLIGAGVCLFIAMVLAIIGYEICLWVALCLGITAGGLFLAFFFYRQCTATFYSHRTDLNVSVRGKSIDTMLTFVEAVERTKAIRVHMLSGLVEKNSE